jgi:hypothetical protein
VAANSIARSGRRQSSEAQCAGEVLALNHTVAHLTLLCSGVKARPWLVDLARSFPWVHWTPPFPLIRERTMWLAAAAARSASTFGTGVVDLQGSAVVRRDIPGAELAKVADRSAIGVLRRSKARVAPLAESLAALSWQRPDPPRDSPPSRRIAQSLTHRHSQP